MITDNQKWITSQMLKRGVFWGILAGVIFAGYEMAINLFIGQPFFGPLRLISSIVLGEQALDPEYSILNSAAVGLIVHVVLSAIYGTIFINLIGVIRRYTNPLSMRIVFGMLYGSALWIINFLIIAPMAFPQFTEVNQFWNGFVAHTFFFGLVLGMMGHVVKPVTTTSIKTAENVSEQHRQAI